MFYLVDKELSVEGKGHERYADLTAREARTGGRVIGGDLGDLWFEGYEVRDGRTYLTNPMLSVHSVMTKEEIIERAEQTLQESFDSVGIETLYSS